MVNLFISYSHQDEPLRVELEKHLSILRRNKIIDAWHDRKIDAGSDFSSAISAHMKQANIILLLVSADFLNSDYCYEIEMQEAMRMHEHRESAVIPIILRHCAWHNSLFGKLLALPRDGKPVSSFHNKDEAFLEIVNGIEAKIRSLKTTNKTSEPVRSMDSILPTAIRSTNLTITKNFSDLEKDKFLRESFGIIVNYFEGSLEALEKENPDINSIFDRIDSQTFSAIIYRDGKKECECMIFMGSHFLSKSINYSSQINLLKNSLSESLQVVDNNHMLLLKPLGMSQFRAAGNGEISQVGAAEFYWQLLIARLQKR